MGNWKKLGVLAVAVFALSAIATASASATAFTSTNSSGALTGSANSPQAFAISNGTVTCNTATINGNIVSTQANEQTVSVNYGSCKAAGLISVNISTASYTFTAGGQNTLCNSESMKSSCTNALSCNSGMAPSLSSCNMDKESNATAVINNTITFNVGGSCQLFVGPQSVTAVKFGNTGTGGINEHTTATGIKINGNGGFCTASNNGTYNGDNTIKSSVSSLTYDP